MNSIFSYPGITPFSINNITVPEETLPDIKTRQSPVLENAGENPIINGSLESMQGLARNCDSIARLLDTKLTDLIPGGLVLTNGITRVLGEYLPKKRKIRYYSMEPDYVEITSIHERFHAIHHLTPDPLRNNSIWTSFSSVPEFYLELLAQLCTFKTVENNSRLYDSFLRLNKEQNFIYQTWSVFRHFTKAMTEELYWEIRNRFENRQPIPLLDSLYESCRFAELDAAVFEGIKSTIHRFRTRPYEYFTEADIHSSLIRDILGNSVNLFLLRPDDNSALSVQLLHQEYPTNFRYSKADLKNKNKSVAEIIETISRNPKYGDRGHYDISVLNPEFVKNCFREADGNSKQALEMIINKSHKTSVNRNFADDLLFAIEVKFFHFFNVNNQAMELEVLADLKKLLLTKQYYNNSIIRPVQLIFCSSSLSVKGRTSPAEIIKSSITGDQPGNDSVLRIFVEAFVDENTQTKAEPRRAVFNSSTPFWKNELIKALHYDPDNPPRR